MITASQFRTDLPEFADTTRFPDATLTLWLTVATNQVANADRWGDLISIGQELCAAHYITLAARDQVAGVSGIPGQFTGPMTSKSVGDVSVSYDVSTLTAAGAGGWNMTTYGVRYMDLVRLVGAGGIQILPSSF